MPVYYFELRCNGPYFSAASVMKIEAPSLIVAFRDAKNAPSVIKQKCLREPVISVITHEEYLQKANL